jgi:hypothetical protein
LNIEVTNWLLEGPEWLKYAVELQLLDLQPDVRPVLKNSAIMEITRRLKDGLVGIPALKIGKVHYTETGKAYWDLFFLADVGLTINELGLDREAEEIFHRQAADGSFTIPPNVKDNYFCMSAILISSLARMGYQDDPRLKKYIQAIMNSQTPDGGWHCYNSYPDMMDIESCPMDNLNILMLLGQYSEYRKSPRLNGAVASLLEHWERRATGWRPHGFGMGERFMSLHSLFPRAAGSRSFHSMLDSVHKKASCGRYYAEITDDSYAEFDFAQKEQPSRWLTFLINRIEKQAGECR